MDAAVITQHVVNWSYACLPQGGVGMPDGVPPILALAEVRIPKTIVTNWSAAHIDALTKTPAVNPHEWNVADLITMALYASPWRIAYEIKTAYPDFQNDMRDPGKRQYLMAFAHQFYYVAHVGVLGKSDIPEGCGLLLVRPDGRIARALDAPYRRVPDSLPWDVMRHLLRRFGVHGLYPTKRRYGHEPQPAARIVSA